MVRIARALLLAAALALPLPGAVAAQEARELTDAERAMRNLALGLAALAAIGLAIRAAEDDDEEEEPAPPRRLPAACLVDWPVRDGTVRLYDPDCLEARFERSGELPLDCAVTVRSRGRFVSGFDPSCLRESGWRTEAWD
jgi:hypothetical protein